MFAARFRENAARALLLPRRFPGKRTPLWLQRRKSADLLKVAARFPQFPILLETYRECLKDVFDLPALVEIMHAVEMRRIKVEQVHTDRPSPFAQTMLFDFTAQFIYDADAPLAERRAQALALDHVQLKELLGTADYRQLLDPDLFEPLLLELQRLDRKPLAGADDIHNLLLALGDLNHTELRVRIDEQRSEVELEDWLRELLDRRRAVELNIAGEARLVAVEDAARFRDALGAALPVGLPAALLEPVAAPIDDLVSRYARTHPPFTEQELCARLGLAPALAQQALIRLASAGRVAQGQYTPECQASEWVDLQVLGILKRRSLARWRQQIEPVSQQQLARFLPIWQHVNQRKNGLDGLLDIVEQLQGYPMPASVLESQILPVRIKDYTPSMLDELCISGEVLWRGHSSIGAKDGRIQLYLADHFPLLNEPDESFKHKLPNDELAMRITDVLQRQSALFFEDLLGEVGGFPATVLETLWDMVWAGLVSNDSLNALRARLRESSSSSTSTRGRARASRRANRFRSRRVQQAPGSEGRWSLLRRSAWQVPEPTEKRAALATQLLERYGILTRELISRESPPGGFAGLYPVLKAMEDSGRARRGYFIDALAASQFAVPGAEDRLRDSQADDTQEPLLLAASDPANAYGAAIAWPAAAEGINFRPTRGAGARIILDAGRLLAYLPRASSAVYCYAQNSEPERGEQLAAIARTLRDLGQTEPLLINEIDAQPALDTDLGSVLLETGFESGFKGLRLTQARSPKAQPANTRFAKKVPTDA